MPQSESCTFTKFPQGKEKKKGEGNRGLNDPQCITTGGEKGSKEERRVSQDNDGAIESKKKKEGKEGYI